MPRYLLVPVLAVACLSFSAQADQRTAEQSSDVPSFLTDLWSDARSAGIDRRTFDAAFADFAPDSRVIAATRHEPEYGKPIGVYISSIASQDRISAGRDKALQWGSVLDAIERRFKVERWVILALWGIETSYGADRDRWDVIRSLATLAWAHYRHPYFRNELLAALKILQEGHVSRDRMVGSWAGAMGQPQFMPSNFFRYAVDFSGDGRRDIWTNVPDVLASIGNYLNLEGWASGLPWGFEVVLPPGFDYRRSRASFAEWARMGLRRADGATLPLDGDAILLFPSGATGPGFLVTRNFAVLKLYNNSDVYALAVGHLADRMHGTPPFRGIWPKVDPQLSRQVRIALQLKLAELGYPVHDFEGRFDFDLRDAIREIQAKFGMVPDGQPTPALLEDLGIPSR